MPPNSTPSSVDRSILPVERMLAQPSADAASLVRLVTDSVSADGEKGFTAWILNHPHPAASEAKIVRMYHREDGGVEVYSSDGQMFVRTVIPERVIRFFDEVMDVDTFVAFIAEAEADEEDEEEEEIPEPEPEPEPAPIPAPSTDPNAAP